MATATRIRHRTLQTGARGTINSSREVKTSGAASAAVSEISKEIQATVKDPNPGYVGVTGGLTKNMGDYNSIKVAVQVSLPCEPTDQGVKDAYAKASALVDEFLDAEYKAAVGETPNKD